MPALATTDGQSLLDQQAIATTRGMPRRFIVEYSFSPSRACLIEPHATPSSPCTETNNLEDSFELSLDIMRLTAQIARDDWQEASKKVRSARTLLDAVGVATRANQEVPRSQQAVGGSVIGRAVGVLCDGDSVPSDAVEPCQDLRDLLIQGVTDDEDSDLNAALSSLVDAYQLRPNE
jgi:hypothetical protein